MLNFIIIMGRLKGSVLCVKRIWTLIRLRLIEDKNFVNLLRVNLLERLKNFVLFASNFLGLFFADWSFRKFAIIITVYPFNH